MYISKKTKNVLIFVGIIVLIALVLPLLFNINSDDDYTKARTDWSVGIIDENGNFDGESKHAMVSELIEIEGGFKVVPDYTAGITYDVVLFDEDGNYKDTFRAGVKQTLVHDADSLEATYIRVIVYPDDEDIKWVEKFVYAGKIEIFTKAADSDVE